MKALLILPILLLAACGADGPPTAPGSTETETTGLRLSGEARIGIVRQVN